MSGKSCRESNKITTIKQRYYMLGMIYFVMGSLSLVVSLFTNISDKIFLGSIFLFLGALMGCNAFYGFRDGEKPWHQTLIAVTTWVAGLVFLFHPLAEVIMLDFFISTYFFVDGAMRMLEYIRIKVLKGSFWILFSGILEVMFGFVSWWQGYGSMHIIRLMFTVYLMIAGSLAILSTKS